MKRETLNKEKILDFAEDMKYDDLDDLITDLQNILEDKSQEIYHRYCILQDMVEYLQNIDDVELFTIDNTTYHVSSIIDLLVDELGE